MMKIGWNDFISDGLEGFEPEFKKQCIKGRISFLRNMVIKSILSGILLGAIISYFINELG